MSTTVFPPEVLCRAYAEREEEKLRAGSVALYFVDLSLSSRAVKSSPAADTS